MNNNKVKTGDYVKFTDSKDWERVDFIVGNRIYTEHRFNIPAHHSRLTEILPYGENILVSEDNDFWIEAIFYNYNKGFETPFVCITDDWEQEFLKKEAIDVISWEFAKPIVEEPIKELTVKEIQDLLGYKIKVVE
jgi:hypothetical protein